jgi:hypothetical protein
MYVCIICMYVRTYVVRMCIMYVCIRMYVYVYVPMHLCLYVSTIYACVYVCMYEYVSMQACMHVCMHILKWAHHTKVLQYYSRALHNTDVTTLTNIALVLALGQAAKVALVPCIVLQNGAL